MTHFSDLGLAAPLLKALDEEGYQTPTPIQAKAIPSLLVGRDLLGIAQTGTGKTAAFALPILHRLAADPRRAPKWGARVLVLAPTRELASQIAESFETYGRHLSLRIAVVFGGVGYRQQRDALAKGLDVLVATPGRLIDHMTDRTADLSATEVLVLDEADQMLDLGFIKPIRQIVSRMRPERQNLLFSATMPREIAGLADQLLRDPIKVAVTPVSSTVERIAQRVIHVEHGRKRALLAELLSSPDWRRALIFTRTKRGADRVARDLEASGVATAAIHGNKSQNQREIALLAFREGRIRALVATDIAARGIDVDEVTHVVNFELPEVPEVYVHRIGRTARAGASGIAVSLCSGEERDLLKAIERVTRQSIASEDRRGDRSLAADERKGHAGERDDTRSARGRGAAPGRGRDGRPGRDRDGQPRHGAEQRHGPRPQREDRGFRRRDAGTATDEEAQATFGRTRFLSPPGERNRASSGSSHDRGDPRTQGRPNGGGRNRSRRQRSRNPSSERASAG